MVRDNSEPLIQLSSYTRLQLKPIYFQLSIAGMLPEIYVRPNVAEKLLRVVFRLPENGKISAHQLRACNQKACKAVLEGKSVDAVLQMWILNKNTAATWSATRPSTQ